MLPASKALLTGTYKSEVHRWFYVQEPTREVSGPLLWGLGEQVHKGLKGTWQWFRQYVYLYSFTEPKQVLSYPKINNLLEKGPLNNRKSPKKGNLHDAEISRLTTTSSLDHMVLD